MESYGTMAALPVRMPPTTAALPYTAATELTQRVQCCLSPFPRTSCMTFIMSTRTPSDNRRRQPEARKQSLGLLILAHRYQGIGTRGFLSSLWPLLAASPQNVNLTQPNLKDRLSYVHLVPSGQHSSICLTHPYFDGTCSHTT